MEPTESRNVRCQQCHRTAQEVEQQKQQLLLPFRECRVCKLPYYFEFSETKVEYSNQGPGNLLENLCSRALWNLALQRVRLYPAEAVASARGGAHSALHWACCKSAPFELIHALVQAAPSEAIVRDNDPDEDKTPLDILVTKESITEETVQSIRIILETNASSCNADGINGHAILNRAYLECSGYVTESLAKPAKPDLRPFLFNEALADFEATFEHRWNVLCLIARVMCYRTTDQDSRPCLHSLVSARNIHVNAVRFGMKLFPHELLEQDDHGHTPLHLALIRLKHRGTFDPLMNRMMNERIFRAVLERCPRAAGICSFDDKLPLHAAACNPVEWRIVQLLVEAFPSAVDIPDPETCLLPLLAAATGSCCNPVNEEAWGTGGRLSSVYCLLRESPSQLLTLFQTPSSVTLEPS